MYMYECYVCVYISFYSLALPPKIPKAMTSGTIRITSTKDPGCIIEMPFTIKILGLLGNIYDGRSGTANVQAKPRTHCCTDWW